MKQFTPIMGENSALCFSMSDCFGNFKNKKLIFPTKNQ